MTEPKDNAEPTGASGGYGFAGRFTRRMALVAAAVAGCWERNGQPAKPKRAVTVCSGCGTEWWSQSGKPPAPIAKCPNCPMSPEELESLIEQMRKRN